MSGEPAEVVTMSAATHCPECGVLTSDWPAMVNCTHCGEEAQNYTAVLTTTYDAMREALECQEDFWHIGRLSDREQNKMYRKWQKHPQWEGTIEALSIKLRRNALAILRAEGSGEDGK